MSRPTSLPPRWAALAVALGGVAALAEACGVSTQTIWRWGRGEKLPGPIVRQHVSALARRRKLADPWQGEKKKRTAPACTNPSLCGDPSCDGDCGY